MKKYLLSVCLLMVVCASYAQFPSIDSMRRYNNRYIRTSPIEAFTNYRLNTLIHGILNWVDDSLSVGGGGGGSSNLTVGSRTSTSLTVFSDGGTDAVIPRATHLLAGLVAAEDMRRWDSSFHLGNESGTYSDSLFVRVNDSTAYIKVVFRDGGNTDSSLAMIAGALTQRKILISEAGLSLTDIATNNASTTKHGFLKKLSNVATEYMDGTGNWSVPPGSGGGGGGASTMQQIHDTLHFNPTPPAFTVASSQYRSDFMVMGAAIVRPSGTWSNGVTIPWIILADPDHGPSFFTSAAGNVTDKRLRVQYPPVKHVLNVTIIPDESYAGNGIIVGPTVALYYFDAVITQPVDQAVKLRGAGTSTWAKSGTYAANFDVTTFSTADGGTSFNILSGWGVDYNTVNIQYIGPNKWTVKRIYSGLGAYNVKFILLDALGNPVTDNPTSTDEIVITNGGKQANSVHSDVYNSTNTFYNSTFNFWVTGLFEAWMVVTPSTTTSNWVRWQTDYPSATTYKIYRDITAAFSTPTLIYTGTAGYYKDILLTTNTLYHYKMVAVVGGVDTEVTTFKCKTME